jgi:hypothetical protein
MGPVNISNIARVSKRFAANLSGANFQKISWPHPALGSLPGWGQVGSCLFGSRVVSCYRREWVCTLGPVAWCRTIDVPDGVVPSLALSQL